MARIRRGRRTDRTRWEADNRLALNPGPFLAIGALVALLAGLAVLLWLFD
jgi:prepilin signal peptidase PulO-like enzyme (type II secretory pathway)